MLTGPALDPELRAEAARACHAASRDFTFSSVAARLADQLPQPAPSIPSIPSTNGSSPHAKPPTRVLVAGHDLKFLAPIREAIAASGNTIAEDVWQSHTEHNEAASRLALEQADVILCEWCLGNAVWYSRNKRPDQRLVVRLHRMEIYTDYPADIDIGNVHRVVCVSKHIADEAIERFGWDPDKLLVIPNSIDVERFRLSKPEEALHTLAMVGYVPQRKRLDLALDVIESLRRRDPRFRLLLIGHPPSGFGWVVRRPDEVDFFRRCYARIQASDELRGAVTFLPFTENLPPVFQQAGFVLSTSDSEGHQVALAEGAASGAVPVIIDRPGARDQYPSRWVYSSVGQAVDAVAELGIDEWRSEGTIAADHAADWLPRSILPRWMETLELESQSLAGTRQGEGAFADRMVSP